MFSRNDVVLECSNCTKPFLLDTWLPSLNYVDWNCDWSCRRSIDSSLINEVSIKLMLPDFCLCGQCGHPNWSHERRRLGELDANDGWESIEQRVDIPDEWRGAPRARSYTEESVWACLTDALEPNKIRSILLGLLNRYNDPYRELPVAPILKVSEQHKKVLEAVVASFESIHGVSRLLVAEAYRELGQFEQAISTLADAQETEDFVIRQIIALARSGVSGLAMLRSRTDVLQEFQINRLNQIPVSKSLKLPGKWIYQNRQLFPWEHLVNALVVLDSGAGTLRIESVFFRDWNDGGPLFNTVGESGGQYATQAFNTGHFETICLAATEEAYFSTMFWSCIGETVELSDAERIKLKDLVDGVRSPENGMERHFRNVIGGTAIPCCLVENAWFLHAKGYPFDLRMLPNEWCEQFDGHESDEARIHREVINRQSLENARLVMKRQHQHVNEWTVPKSWLAVYAGIDGQD